jgi:hypothetical protein
MSAVSEKINNKKPTTTIITPMSTFEPAVVLAILRNSASVSPKDKKEFEVKWKTSVSNIP